MIGADELPHLFERFYRRGTSRSRESGGSGLGIAIVAAVAEVHGGACSPQSPAEGGLVVTVTLPAQHRGACVAQIVGAQAAPQATSPGAPEPDKSGRTVGAKRRPPPRQAPGRSDHG